MKANTSKKTSKDINAMKSKGIVLSIGLIVKNEEKYLDRCLSALKPICDAISTEIVIVDTGSTDRTVEIAKRYTDKVYFFEWIDDFSAARNYGLERCSGEWFMFIDADEIFDEDVSAFVEFFKSGKYKSCSSAFIHLKNYKNEEKTVYDESVPTRLVAISESPRFVNKIHECLIFSTMGKDCDIQVVVHHYGYANDSINEKKLERNMAILKRDYERNPKNAVTLSYLHISSVDIKEKEKYLKRWLKLIDENPATSLELYCYMACVYFYADLKDVPNAVKYSKIFLNNSETQNEMGRLSVLSVMSDLYYYIGDYEKTAEFLTEYQKLYKKYEAGALQHTIKSFLKNIQSFEAERYKYILASCYVHLENMEKAYEIIKETSVQKLSVIHMDQCSCILSEVLSKSNEISKMVEVLNELQDIDNEKARFFWAKCYWDLYKLTSSEGLDKDVNNAGYKESLYTFLMGTSKEKTQSFGGIMCEVLMNEGKAGYDGLVQSFIDMIPSFAQAYSPVIAAGIKTGCSMQKILSTASRGEIAAMCQKLFAGLGKDEYAEIVVPYVNAYGVETLQELFFMIELLAPIRTVEPEIYYSFAMLVANYVTNVYSEEVLNDEDVNILPPNDAFGYYVYKADVAQNAGDKIGFVKALRQALKICPDFKETVVMLTEALGEEIEG